MKTFEEIISQNLLYDLQEGKVDCDCQNFYYFRALDGDRFYFGYYHKTEESWWNACEGVYDLSVVETSEGNLSVLDEFDLMECASKEEASERFFDHFERLYQEDYPLAELTETVVNGESALRQLRAFEGNRVAIMWSIHTHGSAVAMAEERQEALLPPEVLEMLGCQSHDLFIQRYGKLAATDLDQLVKTLRTLYDRKRIADDYIGKLLLEKEK